MREDDTPFQSPDTTPTMREDDTPFQSPDTSPTMREDDISLHSPNTSPTMRNRMGEEKTGVGSPSHWLYRGSPLSFPALLLMISGLLMVTGAGAGAASVEIQVALRTDEALLICPLTEDVNQTKHGVLISDFSNPSDQVTLLGCDWLKLDPHNLKCDSHYNFSLVAIETDRVLLRAPQTQLCKDGSYLCQLLPPDDDQPFTTCLIFCSDNAEDPPTTASPVAPSTTAADQPQPHDQTEKVSTGADGGDPGGLVVVVALSFTVVILLLINIVGFYVFQRYWRRITQTPVNTPEMERQLMNGVA